MSDLASRLRASVKACRALDRSQLLAEAADFVERASWRSVAEHPVPQARVIVCRNINGNRYVDMISNGDVPADGLAPYPTLLNVTHWMPAPRPPE